MALIYKKFSSSIDMKLNKTYSSLNCGYQSDVVSHVSPQFIIVNRNLFTKLPRQSMQYLQYKWGSQAQSI